MLKDCTNEAQNIVSVLEKFTVDLRDSDNRSRHSVVSGNNITDLKPVVFKLKNYLAVDYFAEEFISYEGIKTLVEIIQITSGNTRVSSINPGICHQCI